MIPYRRERMLCRCRRCPRCVSGLSDNYSDAEVNAYNWLLAHGIHGFCLWNTTKTVNRTDGSQMTLLAFAVSKGWKLRL